MAQHQRQPYWPLPGVHPATPQPHIPGNSQNRDGAAPRQLRVGAAQLGEVGNSQQQTATAPQQFCQARETGVTCYGSRA